MKQWTESEVWNKVTAYCALTERARAEVEEQMRKWQQSADVIKRLADRLEQDGYIDADRYARCFVHDKYALSGWGKQKIAWALRAKRIDDDIIERHLDAIDEEEYLEGLRRLLASKRRTLRGENAYEQRAKLLRFAIGRGFSMEEVLQAEADNQPPHL